MIANVNKKMESKKLLAAVAVLAMVMCAFVAVMPAEETDAAPGDVTYLSGTITSSQSFGNGTIVVVNDNLTIPAGMSLTIQDGAKFTVNEGVTLTINGYLQVDSKAFVTVDGTIQVDRDGYLFNNATYSVGADKTVTTGFIVNGSLTVIRNGTVDAATAQFVEDNPETEEIETIEITPSEAPGQIVLAADAAMDVQSNGRNHGMVQNQTVMMNNGSSFTLNGDADGVTVIAGVDADLQSQASIDYTIPAEAVSSFNRLVFTASTTQIAGYTAGEDSKAVATNVNAGVLDIAGTLNVGSLTVAGKASTTVFATDKMVAGDYVCVDATIAGDLRVSSEATLTATHIDVAGTVTSAGTLSITDAEVAGTVTASGNTTVAGDIVVNGALDIRGTSVFTAAVFDVSGTLTIVPAENVAPVLTGSYLNILEDGTASIAKYAEDLANFSGAYYTDANETAYFSGFSEALAAATEAKAFDVYLSGYGDYVYTIAEDVTIDNGIYVVIDGTVKIAEGYTLTIDNGDVSSANDLKALIVVEGTLVDNVGFDFVYSETQAAIASADLLLNAEVMTTDEDNTYYSYTSLVNALSGMTSGTVSLFGNVAVDANLEIPAGVTVDTAGKNLNIANNVDLAVNGVIDLTNGGAIVIEDAAADVKDAKKGTVTVNNYIVGADVTTYSAEISGFYATGDIGDYLDENFIMSADVAVNNSAELGAISMYGTLTVGDLAFTNAEEQNQVLNVCGKLTAGTITVDGFTVDIKDTAVFNGTIANAEGSVVLTNVRGVVVEDATVEDADRLEISGTPVAMEIPEGEMEAPASTIVFAGTVYMDNMTLTVLKDVTVPADATVNVFGTVTGVQTMTVEGTLAVINGASVTGVQILNVIGTVTVAAVTETETTPGNLSVQDIYAGITAENVAKGEAVSSTAAVIDGTVGISGAAYVASGATLSEGFTEGMNSATFSVEGSEWFTVYSDDENINVNKAPIANGYFLGWATEENGDVVYKGEQETPVAILLNPEGVTYYSVGDYDIYEITVITDGNINAVSVGGVVLVKSGNVFVTMNPMTAGVKDIAVVAKTGYTAENVEITGTGVSDGSVTLAGTTTTEIVIYITGTEVADQEPASDNGGMGVTDYLLIILVVLVIVLAIVVVMRMMRS